MATYDAFDVVVVPFPFTDRTSTKRRPALVLSVEDFHRKTGHLVLAMITSAAHSSWANDVVLQEWKRIGLPHASIVRSKLFTLDERLVLRRVGALEPVDREQVIDALQKCLYSFR
ncbi:MAG: type II toxin-antitoxin system PemK/MazF family toxin [Opitutales bacterium]|nr:type II toxin-antitoxin system PemK/MazF family toxin [Opitutales bacterium]